MSTFDQIHVIINRTTISTPSHDQNEVDFSEYPWSDQYIVKEPWAIPLLIAAAINMISIVLFEVCTVVRAFRGSPSRRHFFLCQSLLIGLVLMSVSGLSFALQPSPFSCSCCRIFLGLSPAIVFGTMIVKCVFLMSVNSGVYLPSYYQSLLLFFIVFVQVTIEVQWLSTLPTQVRMIEASKENSIWLCETSFKDYITSLLYVMILVLMVATFSIRCRRIKENFRESLFLGTSISLIIPFWLLWTLTGFALHERVQPACLGFGMVVSSAIVFIVMFVAKSILSQKYLLKTSVAERKAKKCWKTDSDSESSSSCMEEKYAPSFFLFKPMHEAIKNNFMLSRSIHDFQNKNISLHNFQNKNLLKNTIQNKNYFNHNEKSFENHESRNSSNFKFDENISEGGKTDEKPSDIENNTSITEKSSCAVPISTNGAKVETTKLELASSREKPTPDIILIAHSSEVEIQEKNPNLDFGSTAKPHSNIEDEGIYSTLNTIPYEDQTLNLDTCESHIRKSSFNSNVYLFRSYSEAGMLY